jgi:class 3 adenylate cyclase
MNRPETKYARSGKIHIAYQVVGNGPIDLVMVPGFISHVEEAWETPSMARYLTRLSEFSRLIVFDKPGTGLSDPVVGVLPLDERMDHVRAILPALHVPTLIIHRAGDKAVPVRAARYLAEHIPGARYVEQPGADHFPWLGDVDGLLDEVEEFLTGARQSREIDRVLATVLFTDIVGSTEHAAKLGDRGWRDLLHEHNTVVRREITRMRGREVGTAGDGFLATFDGPARAIRCACAIQNAVKPLGIAVRAGLHTGECELIGDDVGGIAVHIGARVAAMANPGEVLVSSTVKDLVAGSGLCFIDRGTRPLKGVPGEWRLYGVDEKRGPSPFSRN